jgi:VWFA-related protein
MTLLSDLVLAGFLAAAPPEAQAPPVFDVIVETVYLDVSVTDHHGEPVTGLGAPDFEVRDNGVLQDPRLVDRGTVGANVALVFDTSESLDKRIAVLRSAGHSFIDGLGAHDQATLLTFSEGILCPAPLTRDRAALHRALDRLAPQGATALRDALYLGIMRPAAGGRRLVVLFTDGEDNESWLSREDLLAAARESDVVVDVVALVRPATGRQGAWLGLPPQEEETEHVRFLRQVTQTTGGTLWSASSKGLAEAFERVLVAMRTRYLLGYEPRGVVSEGRHRLRVSVKRRGVDVRARTEYEVAQPPHQSSAAAR